MRNPAVTPHVPHLTYVETSALLEGARLNPLVAPHGFYYFDDQNICHYKFLDSTKRPVSGFFDASETVRNVEQAFHDDQNKKETSAKKQLEHNARDLLMQGRKSNNLEIVFQIPTNQEVEQERNKLLENNKKREVIKKNRELLEKIKSEKEKKEILNKLNEEKEKIQSEIEKIREHLSLKKSAKEESEKKQSEKPEDDDTYKTLAYSVKGALLLANKISKLDKDIEELNFILCKKEGAAKTIERRCENIAINESIDLGREDELRNEINKENKYLNSEDNKEYLYASVSSDGVVMRYDIEQRCFIQHPKKLKVKHSNVSGSFDKKAVEIQGEITQHCAFTSDIVIKGKIISYQSRVDIKIDKTIGLSQTEVDKSIWLQNQIAHAVKLQRQLGDSFRKLRAFDFPISAFLPSLLNPLRRRIDTPVILNGIFPLLVFSYGSLSLSLLHQTYTGMEKSHNVFPSFEDFVRHYIHFTKELGIDGLTVADDSWILDYAKNIKREDNTENGLIPFYKSQYEKRIGIIEAPVAQTQPIALPQHNDGAGLHSHIEFSELEFAEESLEKSRSSVSVQSLSQTSGISSLPTVSRDEPGSSAMNVKKWARHKRQALSCISEVDKENFEAMIDLFYDLSLKLFCEDKRQYADFTVWLMHTDGLIRKLSTVCPGELHHVLRDGITPFIKDYAYTNTVNLTCHLIQFFSTIDHVNKSKIDDVLRAILRDQYLAQYNDRSDAGKLDAQWNAFFKFFYAHDLMRGNNADFKKWLHAKDGYVAKLVPIFLEIETKIKQNSADSLSLCAFRESLLSDVYEKWDSHSELTNALLSRVQVQEDDFNGLRENIVCSLKEIRNTHEDFRWDSFFKFVYEKDPFQNCTAQEGDQLLQWLHDADSHPYVNQLIPIFLEIESEIQSSDCSDLRKQDLKLLRQGLMSEINQHISDKKYQGSDVLKHDKELTEKLIAKAESLETGIISVFIKRVVGLLAALLLFCTGLFPVCIPVSDQFRHTFFFYDSGKRYTESFEQMLPSQEQQVERSRSKVCRV